MTCIERGGASSASAVEPARCAAGGVKCTIWSVRDDANGHND